MTALGDVFAMTTGMGPNATDVYLVGPVMIATLDVQLDFLVQIVLNVI